MLAQYKVLYTHQKSKKHKTWKDGLLQVYQSKAILRDDGSHDQLDTIYIKSQQVGVGLMLDSDRYIIDVDQLDCSVGGANPATPTVAHVTSSISDGYPDPSTSDHMIPISDHVIPVSDHVTTPRSGGDIIKLLRMTSSKDHMTSRVAKSSTTSESTFPMFGVCATVKRTRSLDTPSNVTNQLQLFDNDMFDNDPYNQKENFTSDDNFLWWLNDEHCHDNITENHTVKLLHGSNIGCQSNTMVTRAGGIKKSVQLFNSPYMSVDDKEGNSSAAVWSNKKRKMSTYDTVAITNSSGTTATRSRPARNSSCYGSKLHLIVPSVEECQRSSSPQRDHVILTCYPSVVAYRDTLHQVILEHINIMVYDIISKYHLIMNNIDYSAIPLAGEVMVTEEGGASSNTPYCKHGPAQLRTVKKEGVNKGRLFYSCNQPITAVDKCKFFQWADEITSSSDGCYGDKHRSKTKLKSISDLIGYCSANGIALYPDCELIGRSQHIKLITPNNKYKVINSSAQVLYIILSHRESSTAYNKDDLWIISNNLQFSPGNSFVARSTFYGPTSGDHLEVCPISGYSPSNWCSGVRVTALHLSNVSTELCCLDNLSEYLYVNSFPLLPHLISLDDCHGNGNGQFMAPFLAGNHSNKLYLSWDKIEPLITAISDEYHLNQDQQLSLSQCARMFTTDHSPISLIHGVFGSGKSYLLSVIVIFLTELFPLLEANNPSSSSSSLQHSSHAPSLKLLISSSTNVAVDRVLIGLLELGFTEMIRVGSIKKIAKPVLPYSVHMSGDDQELSELQEMFRRPDLTDHERKLVGESIKRHKMGINKKRLSEVRVVGATCAACLFDIMKNYQFTVVLLDEASQMSEPVSLLPIARFGCHKLLLLGDPKQLPPTIQGSEASHDHGLEQTLFERLSLMGHQPIMLRTQYRCHPRLSSLSNQLFYNNQLIDGVSEEQRSPVHALLPSLCFCDVVGGREQCDRDGSYSNPQEAQFIVSLLEVFVQWKVPLESVGVIVLYRSQVGMIKNKLTDCKQMTSAQKSIMISTVDAFQGGERDIVILSCVRTKHAGFIDSDRRVNVALTRAKRHLLIVGNRHMLHANQLWGRIINYCNGYDDGVMDHRQLLLTITTNDT